MNMNVFLADDNVRFRHMVRTLLAMQPNVEVVGEAANGRDAVTQIVARPPDVAVLDIVMPELDGLAATREIRQQCPGVQVVIVSMHDTDEYIQDALQAGACGYVLKESTGQELVAALHAASTGQRFLSAQIAVSWGDN